MIRDADAVPWFRKEWPLSDQMQQQVREHVDTLEGEKREDYIKYLTGMCGYKMTFHKEA